MTNILTPAKAANFVRCAADDAVMLQFLPLVDAYLKHATGHDWAADASIDPSAELAAGMLLTYWYDNPSLVGQSPAALTGSLVLLEAIALKYRKYEFDGLDGAGSICLEGVRKGDVVISVTGVYGVSGDQTASFESTVSEDERFAQLDTSDLSDNRYVLVLKRPSDEVSA